MEESSDVSQCWVYITKLNRPITLLHLSQATNVFPIFQVRILENSQIGLFTSVHRPSASAPSTPAEDLPFEEMVCGAPDALVPHNQWVHFAVGCRKPKGADHAEARIFINGARVAVMRVRYPVPIPPSTPVTAPQLLAKPTIPLEAIRASVGRIYRAPSDVGKSKASDESMGRGEDNELMLGRMLLLEDAIPEDAVLLIHHLVSLKMIDAIQISHLEQGPRYYGNLQEALGKFLTCEWNGLGQADKQMRQPHPSTSTSMP